MTHDTPVWRWIPAGRPQRPARNMAIDEAIFRRRPVVPTLRLYRWEPPGLSLGYFQTAEPAEIEGFRAAGFDIVRRMTGGGAIAHEGELTFSIVLAGADPLHPRGLVASYETTHGALIDALADVGIQARLRGDGEADDAPFLCFHRSTGFDIVTKAGRKLVGSAQRRSRGAFFQHGSIPVEPNRHTPLATSVHDAAGRRVGYDELEHAVARRIAERFGVRLERGTLETDERAIAERMERERYSNDDWTYKRRSRP